jgi:hypothetical protein
MTVASDQMEGKRLLPPPPPPARTTSLTKPPSPKADKPENEQLIEEHFKPHAKKNSEDLIPLGTEADGDSLPLCLSVETTRRFAVNYELDGQSDGGESVEDQEIMLAFHPASGQDSGQESSQEGDGEDGEVSFHVGETNFPRLIVSNAQQDTTEEHPESASPEGGQAPDEPIRDSGFACPAQGQARHRRLSRDPSESAGAAQGPRGQESDLQQEEEGRRLAGELLHSRASEQVTAAASPGS